MALRPDLEMDSDTDDHASKMLAKQWIQQRYEDTSKLIFHQQQEQSNLKSAVVKTTQAIPTFSPTKWYDNYGNTAMYMIAQLPKRTTVASDSGTSTATQTK